MKSRDFSQFASADPAVKSLLEVLASPETHSDAYRNAMYELGQHLASGVMKEAGDITSDDKDVCVVCTVEDADFLAKGVLNGLLSGGIPSTRLHLQCFWNEKVRDEKISLSPISRQYVEEFKSKNLTYVIVKSIISGACVVKTNLTRALSTRPDADVFVASPVLLDGAQTRLGEEFPHQISDRFKYVWFATDYEKKGEDVIPGIGGSVYERLSLGDEHQKNKYVPSIVKARRAEFFAAAA